MTLNINLLLCCQSYACCDQTADATNRITRFHYKVALYFSYLHMKIDDEIKRESLRISSIISDYPASKVILTSRLDDIHSQSLLLDTSVT